MVEEQPQQDKEVKETQEKQEEKTQLSKGKLLQRIALVVSITLIVVLVIVKAYNPEFPLGWVIILGGISVFIALFGIFGLKFVKNITNKVKKEFEKSKEIP